MIKIYRASPRCYELAHSRRSPDTAEWRVIHYMARAHAAPKEKIISDLGVDSSVLNKLSQARIIIPDGRVSVNVS